MKAFSNETRKQNLDRLSKELFDIVIIGGGITGAGTARDAASRGMKVALVEARDFAFGTSSRSSKMIHGGIRYLEQREFHLVFEALSERTKLFELAPNLVHPIRFLLPLYKGDRVGMGLMGLGMWLYDALAMFAVPQMHERLNPQEALRRVGILREEGLLGAYEYSDAYMDDDRLVLQTLRSANEMGMVAVNYASVVGSNRDGEKIKNLIVKDQVRGREFEIRGRHFISTVGPWTDIFGEKVVPDWKKILRPSKGIHLTLDRSRLPLEKALVLSTRSDKRIIFAIPRHEMIVVGTTDTDFSGDPADVHTDENDFEYLLGILDDYFPGAKLKKEDFLASYAGVRPLVHDGSTTESGTSREHTIFTHPSGVTFVAGGKYTTYRRMSEQTVNHALKHFPVQDRARFACGKTLVPLNPNANAENLRRARRYTQRWARNSRMGLRAVELLAERHGMEAEKMLRFGSRDPVSVWELEAEFAIENTMCLGLQDFYLRRTPLFLARRDHGLGLLEKISVIFADRLGWDDAERIRQFQGVRDHINHELTWQNR